MDEIEKFLSFYTSGDKDKAFKLFLKDPNVSYTQLRMDYIKEIEKRHKEGNQRVGYEFLLSTLINFTDASIFGEMIDFVKTIQGLDLIWRLRDSVKYIFYENEHLKHLFGVFLSAVVNTVALTKKSIDCPTPAYFNWNTLIVNKPHLVGVCLREQFFHKGPIESFAYDVKAAVPKIDQSAEAYAIFLQPIQGLNYTDYFHSFPCKPLIFLIESFTHFCHLLVCPGFVESCCKENAVIYLLDQYPLNQLTSQTPRWEHRKLLQFLSIVEQKQVKPYLEALNESFNACLTQAQADYLSETASYNWLYKVSKRLTVSILNERYGAERALGLRMKMGLREWHDPHKGLPPKEANLGPLPRNYFEEAIRQGIKRRESRQLKPQKKIRMVHIVSQLLDGNHAPSTLVRSLCLSADKTCFELFVISTERLGHYSLSYPYQHYVSESTSIRGKKTIETFHANGIATVVPANLITYESTAFEIVNILETIQADIAIFHGPDEMNYLISNITRTPIRILFDHGTPPAIGAFDFVILSSEDAYNIYFDSIKAMGMECCYLPFHVNVRLNWKQEPTARSELGLPEDAFIMTTISNHLENRLSQPFCEAVAQILLQCPHAVYAPIGNVGNQQHFDQFFENLGVGKQVRFLGQQSAPSQVARSMNLYLNEFPFGSGLAILDAMAAGCPIVSMYDVEGPQQGRYGGSYFGLDHVIQSGDVNDYVNLAVSLIQDPDKYEEWSDYSLKCYEKHTDVQEYVRKFEKILDNLVNQNKSYQSSKKAT